MVTSNRVLGFRDLGFRVLDFRGLGARVIIPSSFWQLCQALSEVLKDSGGVRKKQQKPAPPRAKGFGVKIRHISPPGL